MNQQASASWQGAQRRHHARVRFAHGARFRAEDGWCECEVLDLSLKGALFAPQGNALPSPGQAIELQIALDDAEALICMQGRVAHAEAGVAGIKCEQIDLDSIIRLRRLIELNLGDPALLERELSALLRHD